MYHANAMSRTPLDPALVHDRADVARDARLVDALTERVAAATVPFAREAVARVTAETLASEFVDPAADALRTADRNALEIARRRGRQSLSDAMQAALPSVDEAVATERAKSIAQLVVVAWIAALWDVTESERHRSLLDGLFPDEAHRDRLAEIAQTEGVGDVRGFFAAMREAVLDGREFTALPGGMQLDVVARGREGDVHVAVRRADAEHTSVSEEIAQSGTRMKDGAAEPSAESRGVRGGKR
jgi:hypothetical protein